MEKVILYSTNCPQCTALELQLKERNIPFTVVSDQEEMIQKGFMSVPMLQVGDSIKNFKEALQWAKEVEI